MKMNKSPFKPFRRFAFGLTSAAVIGGVACGPQSIDNPSAVDIEDESDEVLMEMPADIAPSLSFKPDAEARGNAKLPTIAALAQSNPDFSILVAAAAKAGLVDVLNNPRVRLTVFAPTNAAFADLLKRLGVTNGLDGLSVEQLRVILKYHVVAQPITAAQAVAAAKQNAKVETAGGSIALSLQGDALKIDTDSTVVATDLQAKNGIVHVIDRVLLPSIADVVVSDINFFGLKKALLKADEKLVGVLDNDTAQFTVFAPDNHAFGNLIRALRKPDFGFSTGIRRFSNLRGDQLLPILKYHVIAGAQVKASQVPTTSTAVGTLGGQIRALRDDKGGVTIDRSNVTTADLLTSNGVIHVVDNVLLPSITDVVTTDERFSALAGAVIAADQGGSQLAPTLDNDSGAFTVFAPSNAGFASAVLPANAKLAEVLAYHAVPGAKVYANQARFLVNAKVDTALPNKSLVVNGRPSITVSDSTKTPANVVAPTNIFTSNGVIHQIDKVLIP